MTWNYRVMKRVYTTPAGYKEVDHSIYEVYYDKDGEVNGWTEDSVGVHGEDLEELKRALDHYCEALEKPVLDYDELDKNSKKKRSARERAKELGLKNTDNSEYELDVITGKRFDIDD